MCVLACSGIENTCLTFNMQECAAPNVLLFGSEPQEALASSSYSLTTIQVNAIHLALLNLNVPLALLPV